MGKNILIFSDGTGQIGGLRPDQRLSNVYKMYRAMRPGPDSPIHPDEQFAFYDPGLGAGEVGGFTFKRIRKFFASAIGTGIDENIIDCYQAIIAAYEPGDRIFLFGFSRGAYTVRSLANVLNLCGVPTHDGKGNPIPRTGPRLRKIAADAVRYVYNHGAGKDRQKYEAQREIKAQRFRDKYNSNGIGADGEAQGNVQPYFIGVFDTVAALGSRSASAISLVGLMGLIGLTALVWSNTPLWVALPFTLLPLAALNWVWRMWFGQFKYFFDDPERRLRLWNPVDWALAIRNGHMAWWSGKYYDRYLDREVTFARHALSIDEARKKFPRVGWGRPVDIAWHEERGNRTWLKQLWFAGNHSDIGGSYPEEESRLSDIALQWMVDELEAAAPGQIRIRKELLRTAPSPKGLQHDERLAVLAPQPGWLRFLTRDRLTWSESLRDIDSQALLHPTVIHRFEAGPVPHPDATRPYRPENLRRHEQVLEHYPGRQR